MVFIITIIVDTLGILYYDESGHIFPFCPNPEYRRDQDEKIYRSIALSHVNTALAGM